MTRDIADVAAEVVDVVLRDLRDRKGLDHEFDAIDGSVYVELEWTLRRKVVDVLERSAREGNE